MSSRLYVFVVCALVLTSIVPVVAQSPPTVDEKIDPKVWADLQAQGKVTFFVVLREQADTSSALGISDWKEQGQYVVDILKETAERTQKPLLDRLAGAGVDMTPFWIVNTIKVVTSDEQLIKDLAARADVKLIKGNDVWQIPEPLPGTDEPKVQAVEYGVAKVRAPEVWQQFSVRGEGIVVASVDTGVQYNHPALVMQYRGRRADGTFDHNYNWHDPSNVCRSPQGVPCDNAGHGTHTMGTMVGEDGANQIGVAPRAKWIAAKGCESSSCSNTALLSAGQWILAPTDLSGQNPRTDRRPHVVNNSWGSSTTGDTFYQEVVRNWRNAGIFPAFANGNPGSACGGVNVPGAYPESFGVGATDSSDNVASFSGRGPARGFGNIVKPNVSAPGVNVRSSMPGNSYGQMSGTSMATPHLAGVVALVWSASPAMVGNIAATFDILQSTARPRSGTQCGEAGPPNNVYGWGIVDALAAVEQSISGGTLQGRVTDAASAAPLAGIEVRAVGGITRTATTDSNGNYRMVLLAGTYELSAGVFGYRSQNIAGVRIVERQTATQNLALQPLPRHLVFGYVYSTSDGQPLANVAVKILNTPLAAATTDANGYYEFAVGVPEGAYDIQAGTGGCIATLTQRVNVNVDVEADFPLAPKTDDFGYTCVDNLPINWIEGETQLPFAIFDGATTVDLPFPFSFYGQTYNRISIATNGFANFLGDRTDFANTCLPDVRPPNAGIYPLWQHLFVGFGFFAGVFTKTEGEAPNRQFVIEWRNMTVFDLAPSNIATFEILLNEGTGAITFQYNLIGGQANGVRATIGIENQDGTVGLQYSCREPILSAGKTIIFLPPQ
jgi:subtilisin family serine protease